MSDLETQLRAYADHVEAEVEHRMTDDGTATTTPLPVAESHPLDRQRGRSRRPVVALASIAAGVIAVAAVGVWWSTADDSADVDVVDSGPPPTVAPSDDPADPDATPTSGAPTTGDDDADPVDAALDAGSPSMTVEPADQSLAASDGRLDPGPLSPRHDVLLLRTPGEMIVWGGDVEAFNIGRPDLEDAQFADGAVLDLATGEWRIMAPSPLPAIDENPFGAWIDDRAFIARGGEAALYDPSTDAWETVPASPGEFRPALAIPERGEILADGREGHAVYSVATGEWRVIDERENPDLASWDRSLDWTGEVVLSTTMPDIFGGRLVVEQWDPETTAGWTQVSEYGLGQGEQAFDAAWLDGELVVVGYDMNVAAYDPAENSWRRMPDLPVRFQEGVPRILGRVDGEMIVERWPGLGVLSADGAWRVSPANLGTWGGAIAAAGLDGAPAVWSWGLPEAEENSFRVVPAADLQTLPSVLVGFVVLDLEAGESLVEMELDREFFGDETPRATVMLDGGTCTISQFGFDPTTAPGDAATNAEQVDGQWIDLVCDPGVDRDAILARLRPFEWE